MTSPIFCPRPPAKYHLNIEDLISQVRVRPCLWNKNYAGYTDRRYKSRKWDEVCESIIDNWSNLKITHQNAISAEIQKKWRNVKDAFNKEMRKIASGQDVKKKQYCHFKALTFLSNSQANIPNAHVEESDDDSVTSVDHETNTNSAPKRARNEDDEDENSILIKREKVNSDEDNSNGEHRPNKASYDYDLIEIEDNKSENSEENTNISRHETQNKDEFRDKPFVAFKFDDYDSENTQVPNNDRHYQGHVKIYDEDISFTEMMIPLLRRLNDDQKHFATVGILNILQKARNFHPSVSRETQTE